MNNRYSIVAISTPYGIGGIGIVRLSGGNSFSIAKKMCLLKQIDARHAYSTSFYDSEKNKIDRGILIYFKKPFSYTGEDIFEFQCHGSYVLLEKIVNQICKYGARLAKPGEFTYRAFVNNKIDLLQAESVNQIIHSQNLSSIKSAQRTMKGDFSEIINNIIKHIINIRMYVESNIDFSNENIENINLVETKNKISKIANFINNVFDTVKKEENLNKEVKVIITGKPNVGKSTLLNTISKNKIAIVTNYAGTTRDLVKSKVILNNSILEIVDTAGIHNSSNEIEIHGIKIAKQEVKNADIILSIFSFPEVIQKKKYLKSILMQKKSNEIIVLNKIDLHTEELSKFKEKNGIILISAEKKIGIYNLIKKINFLIKQECNIENNFMARKRHTLALQRSLKHVKKSYKMASKRRQFDFLANELYLAQLSLEEITGKFSSDEILGKIFSSFCIGK